MINRLFEIVYILQDRRHVTAKELAERFEVSPRTIYRDIDKLSAANVPVYTQKGKTGGIGLLPGYVLDRATLSEAERGEILAALQSLSAAVENDGAALQKLSALFGERKGAASWVEIDYSDWNPARREQFDLLKRAIIERRAIRFEYVNTGGEQKNREAEPLTLWFKSRAWYLKAFCLAADDFRTFRLSRMRNAELLERVFEPREYLEYDEPAMLPRAYPQIKLRFKSTKNYRLYDDFGPQDITRNPDGSCDAGISAPADEQFVGYILSFGSEAEALEPQSLREAVKAALEKSLRTYS
jgi:predicted DNA-binding transcriptional regulator YafY